MTRACEESKRLKTARDHVRTRMMSEMQPDPSNARGLCLEQSVGCMAKL